MFCQTEEIEKMAKIRAKIEENKNIFSKNSSFNPEFKIKKKKMIKERKSK
jgi:hypothetical protein